MQLAQGNPLLRIDYRAAGEKTGDAQIAVLPAVKHHLAQLDLSGTKVTDAGLKPLADLGKLVRLDLHNSAVGDAGLAHLKGLANLGYLNLYGTQVTDAGLAHLTSLKKLGGLYLWQSKVTEAGVKALQEKLPDTKIIWQ